MRIKKQILINSVFQIDFYRLAVGVVIHKAINLAVIDRPAKVRILVGKQAVIYQAIAGPA